MCRNEESLQSCCWLPAGNFRKSNIPSDSVQGWEKPQDVALVGMRLQMIMIHGSMHHGCLQQIFLLEILLGMPVVLGVLKDVT
jgi:hypothetical protein